MGGSGGRPQCVCKRKNAMRSGALEGFEVHYCGVGFVGSKGEWTNGVEPMRNLRSIGPMPP